MPVDMTECFQAINNRNTWMKRVDEPMQYPWTFVIGLEADSHIIPSPAYADDITSYRVHEVVGCIPCTSNNSEVMLKHCQLIDYCDTKVDMVLPRADVWDA